jgi:hypothetical protein
VGNVAAHQGDVLADIGLYDNVLGLGKWTDADKFLHNYGVPLDFARQHRRCNKLMAILNWTFMKDFIDDDGYINTSFHARAESFLLSIANQASTLSIELDLNSTEKGQKLYNDLRSEHDAMYACFKDARKKK